VSFGVSPFVWFGGKQRLARRIVDLLPPHLVYVEPFGGAAAVLLTKAPSRLEVYNDADGNLVNFFRVLRDEPEELERRLRLTPFARSEFREAVAHWRADFTGIDDPIERARLFWVRIELSFAGCATTVGWGGEFAGRRRGSKAWTSHTKLDRLERISARFRGVQIEHLEWPDVFDRYDGPDAVFYVDPPYVPETRRSNKQAGGKAYPHDLTSVDHEALVERLLTLRGGH
jgi:DNA adenine methylase